MTNDPYEHPSPDHDPDQPPPLDPPGPHPDAPPAPAFEPTSGAGDQPPRTADPPPPVAPPPGAASGDGQRTPQPARRLTRSRDSVIGGVAAGAAEYIGVDPTLVRLAFVVLAFITGGTFVFVYLGAWIIMPEAPAAPAQPAAPHQQQRDSGTSGLLFWGAALILAGLVLLLWQLDVSLPSWDVLLSGVLIAVGVLLLVESRRGLNGGLVTLAVILAVILGLTSIANFTVQGAFGSETVRVNQVEDLDSSYGHAFGSLTLDLDQVQFPEGDTELDLSIAFGNLLVELPDDVGVRATATSLFGRTEVANDSQAGFSVDWEYESANYSSATRRVELNITTLFGSTDVTGGR